MGNSLIGKKMSFSDFIKLCENDNDVNLTHFMVVTSNRILCEYCMPPYEMDGLKLLFYNEVFYFTCYWHCIRYAVVVIN